MSERGRSTSPRPLRDVDMAVDSEKRDAKVVIINNLTRNVVEAHLRIVFGVYGDITKIDLPVYGKSGQNRGKAAVEYVSSSAAQTATSHMDGGQLDGSILKVELSDLPVRSRSRSRSPFRGPKDSRYRSFSRSRTRSRSPSRSPPGGYRRGGGGGGYRGRGGYGRRAPPPRDQYRPRSRSRTRSRSPVRRRNSRLAPRRRSPSYTKGGYDRRRRSRSRSYSVRSSRSRSRSPTRSRSRTRSASYSSYSRYSRSRSRSRSASRGRRSYSRDDIRDSRSRSPPRD